MNYMPELAPNRAFRQLGELLKLGILLTLDTKNLPKELREK